MEANGIHDDVNALNDLESAEQRKLFDCIDDLREHGGGDLKDLPQVVVCGNQSSGKSSLLEAITEVPFPRGELLCTRFATEIILRRSKTKQPPVVNIIPYKNRSAEEKKNLRAFNPHITSLSELPNLIKEASRCMGLDASGSSFSNDVLRIRIVGPDKPHLTIVDLPGLIEAVTDNQKEEDKDVVKSLVDEYIRRPRTIILLVVSAGYDYSNQGILDFVRLADPIRTRTLGVVTHPDAIPNEALRQRFIRLAKNEDLKNNLQLGWHFVMNKKSDESQKDFAARKKTEDTFFAQEPWKSLPDKVLNIGPSIQLGIAPLRKRLSELLFDHIKRALPIVYQDIEKILDGTYRKLTELGTPRLTPSEQSRFLNRLSHRFSRICQNSIDGNYQHQFFGKVTSDETGKIKRLRAVIQNQNTDFSIIMRRKGHNKHILDANDRGAVPRELEASGIEIITRKEAVEWVKTIAHYARGRELPGTLNPDLISELFREQSEPWIQLSKSHLRTQLESIDEFLQLVMQYLEVPIDMANKIFASCINPAMETRQKAAEEELERLLDDRRRHAMTYGLSYLMESERRRVQRQASLDLPPESLQKLCEAIGVFGPQAAHLVGNTLGQKLIELGVIWGQDRSKRGEITVDNQNEELLDRMLAYYQGALETFIDSVNNQVIERWLVENLGEVFDPSTVFYMNPEHISDIAGESQEQREMRRELENRRKALEKGLKTMRSTVKESEKYEREFLVNGNWNADKNDQNGNANSTNGNGNNANGDKNNTTANGNENQKDGEAPPATEPSTAGPSTTEPSTTGGAGVANDIHIALEEDQNDMGSSSQNANGSDKNDGEKMTTEAQYDGSGNDYKVGEQIQGIVGLKCGETDVGEEQDMSEENTDIEDEKKLERMEDSQNHDDLGKEGDGEKEESDEKKREEDNSTLRQTKQKADEADEIYKKFDFEYKRLTSELPIPISKEITNKMETLRSSHRQICDHLDLLVEMGIPAEPDGGEEYLNTKERINFIKGRDEKMKVSLEEEDEKYQRRLKEKKALEILDAAKRARSSEPCIIS